MVHYNTYLEWETDYMHDPINNSSFGGCTHYDILRVWDSIGVEGIYILVPPRTSSKLSTESNVREYLEEIRGKQKSDVNIIEKIYCIK